MDYGYGGYANMNDNNKVQRIILRSGNLVMLDKMINRMREIKQCFLIFSDMVETLHKLAD
jgi:chromodomain-helicase-DNA-binding protein 1